MRRVFVRSALVCAFLGVLWVTGCCPATIPTATPTATATLVPTATRTPQPSPTAAPTSSPTVAVPKEVAESYRSLYAELRKRLDEFEDGLAAGPRQGMPIVAADLAVASSSRGPELLGQGAFMGISNYLLRLEALGARGVSVSLDYPLLAPETPRWREYLNLYGLVAQQVRGRKLKLLVSVGLTPVDPALSRWQPDYSGATLTSLAQGRRQQVETIVRQLKPDYLTIANEPALEGAICGLQLGVPEFTGLVQAILDGLDRQGVLIGAGISTGDDISYVDSLLKETSLDYVDLHLDVLRPDCAAWVADLAGRVHRAGKRLIIGEAWLSKRGAAESDVAPSEVLARDAYGFWQPLDARFVADVVRGSAYQACDWVSLSESQYFFGYLDYGAIPSGFTASQVLDRAVAETARAAALNLVSETGGAFRLAAITWR